MSLLKIWLISFHFPARSFCRYHSKSLSACCVTSRHHPPPHTHKTSSYITSSYKTFSYKTSIYQTSSYRMSRLQNVQVTKHPFYKTSRLQNIQDTKCPVFVNLKTCLKKNCFTKIYQTLHTLCNALRPMDRIK